MTLQARQVTIEEFEVFVNQPGNQDRLYELIGGRVVEVVSNNYSSEIGVTLSFHIKLYLREKQIKGRVTGADGGYEFLGERYIPDVAYVAEARQPEPSRAAYNPVAPDLVVEVLSPSNDPGDMPVKVVNYLRAGTTVWLVDPDKEQVEVYAPDQAPRTLGTGDILTGGAVLPGFTLAVAEIFAE